jgi:hypothetical protein
MVIKFIYLGQCDVADWELNEFLAVGKERQINGILENVDLNNIDKSNNGNKTNIKEPQRPITFNNNYDNSGNTTCEISA